LVYLPPTSNASRLIYAKSFQKKFKENIILEGNSNTDNPNLFWMISFCCQIPGFTFGPFSKVYFPAGGEMNLKKRCHCLISRSYCLFPVQRKIVMNLIQRFTKMWSKSWYVTLIIGGSVKGIYNVRQKFTT